MTPELSQQIAMLRQRIVDRVATREEMAEAILALRQVRSGAAVAARTNVRAKAMGVAAPVDANELLKGLGTMVKK